MAKSNRDSVRECRARKKAEGGKQISVWLEAKTISMLDALRKHFGRSQRGKNAPLIARAIEALHRSIFGK